MTKKIPMINDECQMALCRWLRNWSFELRHSLVIRASSLVIPIWVAGIFFVPLCALANPTGMTVASGTATASQNGSRLTITASQNAFLNWQSFNIAAGETTVFQQPSAQSVVWNRINDPNPSQIFGSLQANGIVVLMNSAGFYFGPNSYVKTGGLIVSTANCLPPQNPGGAWQFNGPPPLSTIANFGKIDIGGGGPAYLIAENVLNYGSINAPGGDVRLAAGQRVVLSERPDGRGLSMQVNLPEGSVDNEGHITADAGTIAMNARTVNQDGFVQANSVRDANGTIELVAADKLNLGANSQISASGDTSAGGSSGLPSHSGASAGGSVTLQSGNLFSDAVGSRIDVNGGSRGGNGGNVEISAPNILSLNSAINARAQAGWTAGKLLLDPDYIILDSSGSGSAGSGTVLAGNNAGSTLDLNVNTAFANLAVSDIILQASYDITLADGTTWNVSGTIGANLGGATSGQLTLEAGRNVIFGDGSSISDANDWSVTLMAGVNNFTTGAVQPGVGSIYLNGGAGLTGSGSIQTAQGSINLTAGQDILVGSGCVITTGGGGISAHALAGNIDTGSDAQGYYFESAVSSLDQAYDLSDGLGGVGTAGGGDVTLIAGGNVASVLPTVNGYIYDGNFLSPNNGDYTTAGAGAYGSAPGNVTIVAGGNVTGHYLVANGVGSIFAGVKMDASGNPVKDLSGKYVLGASGSAGTSQSNPNLALSLVSGGWNVTAAQNILLQEVNNPNGVFDTSAGGAFNHYFNYAPDDYVNLSAGNLVQLGAPAATLPRATGLKIPFIYPSILNITAGAGGVELTGDSAPFNQLILFPSPAGSLTINTTGSLIGSLPTVGSGNAPQMFNLIVSDSGASQYKSSGSFGLNDHAATPVHLGNPTPVALNIGGDMDYVLLGSPEAAQINVGGNMNNCGFQGMNLAAADVTSIHVTGDIFDRGNFTSVDLSGIAGAQGFDLSYLADAIMGPGQPSAPALAGSFYFDPVTKILTYQNIAGQSLQNVLALLNHLMIQEVVNGVPQWELDGITPVPAPNPVSVFGDPTQPGTAAYALLSQYNRLGAIPNNASASGFLLGGGGQFNISARSLDLGNSAGILSKGVGLYKTGASYPLANLFGNGGVFGVNHGADISVTTTGNHSAGITAAGNLVGDLDMNSSSIATLNGGNVSINAGGAVNAGSAVISVNTLGVRGIYTTAQGDVSVIANGDVNVNGSRVASYDGGNVTVESLNGNVNAGTGASVPVAVQAFYEDPVTHAVYFTNPQIPFSGILTLTLPTHNAASYPAPDAMLGNILVEAPNGNVNANAAGILQIPLNQKIYPDAVATVLAGYELRDALGNAVPAAGSEKAVVEPLPPSAGDSSDPARTAIVDGTKYQVSATVWSQLLALLGSPADSQVVSLHVIGDKTDFVAALLGNGTGLANSVNYFSLVSPGRDINVSGSGVIASNARLDASGNINGLIFARNNIDIIAQQNINVSALGVGNVNVNSSGGTISGNYIGVGGVSVSASSIDANLISANVVGSTSGQTGLGQGAAANGASQGLANNESTQAAAASDQGNDEEKKKKGKEIALAQKVSRVTVILPPKKVSETQTPISGT
jgi:filamentous hemagglutinin family protein